MLYVIRHLSEGGELFTKSHHQPQSVSEDNGLHLEQDYTWKKLLMYQSITNRFKLTNRTQSRNL